MDTVQKIYRAPSLADQGQVVDATRFKITGSVEPNGPQLRDVAGDVGFGL